ncbi:MAG: hypothetical protein JNL10_03110 [Verrucomicrobiales bacterium]|nr:hypothetical protein [Verrucomicrobiales bacterium]
MDVVVVMRLSGIRVIRGLVLALLGAGIMAGAHRVLALAGTLNRPSVALPESLGPGWRTQLMKVLEAPDAKFLGGQFINAVTTLRYGGDTGALNQFLAGLAECPEVQIRVQLVRDLDSEWVLQHNGWSDGREFLLRVALDSGRIRLEDVQWPVIRGSRP